MQTIPAVTVKTWKAAGRYILDIADGESVAYGVGNQYPERYTAIAMDALSGQGFGYRLYRNSGNGEIGPCVHIINVNPSTGIEY